jgi:diguanylate cyclase (GGDEF)-like protein
MFKDKNHKSLFLAIISCAVCLLITITLHFSFTYIIYTNSLKYEQKNLKDMVDNVCIVIDTTRDTLKHSKKENGENYTEEEIKQEITSMLRKQFYSFSYDINSYLWINEVHNYNGGKNYAIRLIHTNLKDTEGYPLSTFTFDAGGNLPYLEELNLIKEKGSGFYSYYFKNLNDDNITKKITYARLYKDYNWIICVGIPYKSIICNTLVDSSILKYIIIFGYLSSITGLFILGTYAFKVYKYDKLVLKLKTNSLQEQVNIDTLTKAYSRKYGTDLLEERLLLCKETGNSSIVAMFDIDKFKYVNDTFGHENGDVILIEIVNIIKEHIREEDKLIRWGGDEFIIVFKNLKKTKVNSAIDKLVKYVNKKEFVFSNQSYHASISIGVSNIISTDKTIENVLNRADIALYKAKKKRNTFSINLV